MDADGIAITFFAVVVFGGLTAMVLWAQRRDRRRKRAVIAMATAMGFTMIKGPPESFPLASFPVVRWGEKGTRRFSNAAHGKPGGREVLFFDYFLLQSPAYQTIVAVVAQTIIAARGGQECFPVVNSDPTLQLESVGGWTIAYWRGKLLTAEETRSLVSSIELAEQG